jgi:Putative peptidoglycan binding domain
MLVLGRLFGVLWWALLGVAIFVTVFGIGYTANTIRHHGDGVSLVACPQYMWAGQQQSNCIAGLQRLLDEDPPYAELTHDGVFGRDTKKAIVAFQDMNHLHEDGVAGPATIDILQQLAPKPGKVWVVIFLAGLFVLSAVLLCLMTGRYVAVYGTPAIGKAVITAISAIAGAFLGAPHSPVEFLVCCAVILFLCGLSEIFYSEPAGPPYRSGRASWSICMSSTGAPWISTKATSTPWLGLLGSMMTFWPSRAAARSSTSKATCGTVLTRSG